MGDCFIYLFLAVMSLHCWEGFSLVVASGDYSLVGLCKLIVVVSLAAPGLQGMWASDVAAHGLSSYSSQALVHRLSSCGA